MTTLSGEKPPRERRRNATLRELLEELVDHVRTVARGARDMRSTDLEYAQERLEWLADEIWQTALSGTEDEEKG